MHVLCDFHEIRFRLSHSGLGGGQLGARGLDLSFGYNDSRHGIASSRLSGREPPLASGRRNRNSCFSACDCRLGLGLICLSAGKRHFEVAAVETGEDGSGLNLFVLTHVDVQDYATDFGRDGHDVAVYLRVVGRFAAARIPPPRGDDGDCHHHRDRDPAFGAPCSPPDTLLAY